MEANSLMQMPHEFYSLCAAG